jgi:hypothetical protein
MINAMIALSMLAAGPAIQPKVCFNSFEPFNTYMERNGYSEAAAGGTIQSNGEEVDFFVNPKTNEAVLISKHDKTYCILAKLETFLVLGVSFKHVDVAVNSYYKTHRYDPFK